MNGRRLVSAAIALIVLVIAAYTIVEKRGASGPNAGASLAAVAQAADAADVAAPAGRLIGAGPAYAEVREASAENRYSFLFFYKNDDDQTREMRKVFDTTLRKVGDKANPVLVDMNDPKYTPMVKRYGAGRAPLPLVLALAPNGAVTRGLPGKFTEDQLMEGFVSACTEKCLGALQDQKLTVLCVQQPGSNEGAEAMKGVQQLKDDPQYGPSLEIVTVDPDDSSESKILRDLKVSPKPGGAVTVLLAPPGKVLATLPGAVTKADLVKAIQSSAKKSSCAPGSGSGCCSPKPAKKS